MVIDHNMFFEKNSLCNVCSSFTGYTEFRLVHFFNSIVFFNVLLLYNHDNLKCSRFNICNKLNCISLFPRNHLTAIPNFFCALITVKAEKSLKNLILNNKMHRTFSY